jgi:hypothetical protein
LGQIYNMKNQFWAGLGSQAVLVKKKFGADYEQLLRPVFICFHGEKKKNIVASALKNCIEKGKVGTGENQVFLGLKISM